MLMDLRTLAMCERMEPDAAVLLRTAQRGTDKAAGKRRKSYVRHNAPPPPSRVDEFIWTERNVRLRAIANPISQMSC